MIIVNDEKELEVKFTFNSFKYMEDFSISELAQIDDKPFKVIPILRQLLFGGLNWSPNKRYSLIEVDEITEHLLENEDTDIGDILSEVLEELENSNFFKQLQKKPKKKRNKK